MNVLFLSMAYLNSLADYGMYQDILRVFAEKGDYIKAVCPLQPSVNEKTQVTTSAYGDVLKVNILYAPKQNIINKGRYILRVEKQFISAIKSHYSDIKFDLVLYPTPPVTLAGVVDYIKKRDGARSYLLLKDIFPQNAVDMGLMKKTGFKGLLYRFFRNKEKQLYAVSDRIGCMSPANVDYVLKHNPEISSDRVEVCPNCIEPRNFSLLPKEREAIRTKYGIPLDKKVFVYGGNLGIPQGIPFLIECLRTQKDNSESFFLIVGDGTEFSKLKAFVQREGQGNVMLLKRLPKEDYDRMIAACDVGLIFLDHRFTIPNFPSRLLSYMQAGLPVLACTDPNTDIGKVIMEGGFGWWCESNNPMNFYHTISQILTRNDVSQMGSRSIEYLNKFYTATRSYEIINAHKNNKK